jgi:hypothetical protein
MEGGKTVSLALFIPVLILSLIFGGVGGYYYFKSTTKEKACAPCPKTSSSSEPTTTSTVSPSPTASSIDTSDWKIYDNTKYNYVFRYPASWGVIDYLYDSMTKTKRDQYKIVYLDYNEIPANSLKYASEIPAPLLALIALDEMPTSFGDAGSYVESSITIDKINAKKIISTEPSLLDGTYQTNIYFEKNGQAYSIVYTNDDDTGAHSTVIDEIINTFTFK